MAFLFAMLMWGVIYQGYNAVFPAFYQELFPTKTRVTAFAVSQNAGTISSTTHRGCQPCRGRRAAAGGRAQVRAVGAHEARPSRCASRRR